MYIHAGDLHSPGMDKCGMNEWAIINVINNRIHHLCGGHAPELLHTTWTTSQTTVVIIKLDINLCRGQFILGNTNMYMHFLWFLDRNVVNYTPFDYDDVIMDTMASQITSLAIVYSTVYSGADQRKHQSSASLAFVREIHRRPVNSPHKWPVTRKMVPFDDVTMLWKARIHLS